MPEFTEREACDLLEALRRRRPETGDELHAYIRYFLGVSVPRRAVCAGHAAPFEYVAGALVGGLGDCVVWAPRAGGKTANGAIVTLLECLHRPRLGVRILGGSREQSEKMYANVTAMLAFEPRHGVNALAADLVEGEPLIGRTAFANGSEVGILTQSAKSVRGPHVPRLRLDEVDEFDPEIFQAALKITQSMHGHRGRTEVFSTMHRRFGLMADLVREHRERGFALLKWCLWEIIEPCRDRACSACPLNDECQGRAKEADGYYAIDDAIRLRRHSSRESWETEMLCRRPSTRGVVYAAFDREVHVRPMSRDPNRPTYAAFDFGFENPFVCLFLQTDRDDRLRVFEEYVERGRTTYEHGQALRARFERYGIRRAWGDPSGADERATLRQLGIPVLASRGALAAGIEEIRRRLKVAPETGEPGLLVGDTCANLIREFETYHYPDPREGANAGEEPVKADDHALDALRYAAFGLRGRAPTPHLPAILRPRVFGAAGQRVF
jgi:hypothetical protein